MGRVKLDNLKELLLFISPNLMKIDTQLGCPSDRGNFITEIEGDGAPGSSFPVIRFISLSLYCFKMSG